MAFIGIYLATAATVVVLFDGNTWVGAIGLVLWAIASVLLGWGTGQVAFALLALLPIVFAVPFGYPNNYEFSEPLPIWWSVAICAFFSSILITLGAVAKLIVDHKKAPPKRGFGGSG